MSQLEIHWIENNSESQTFLNENKERLSDQCKKVLELVKSGVRLTTENAVGYGIRSLPRRILDLKENGIIIPSVWVYDNEGKRIGKEWYL